MSMFQESSDFAVNDLSIINTGRDYIDNSTSIVHHHSTSVNQTYNQSNIQGLVINGQVMNSSFTSVVGSAGSNAGGPIPSPPGRGTTPHEATPSPPRTGPLRAFGSAPGYCSILPPRVAYQEPPEPTPLRKGNVSPELSHPIHMRPVLDEDAISSDGALSEPRVAYNQTNVDGFIINGSVTGSMINAYPKGRPLSSAVTLESCGMSPPTRLPLLESEDNIKGRTSDDTSNQRPAPRGHVYHQSGVRGFIINGKVTNSVIWSPPNRVSSNNTKEKLRYRRESGTYPHMRHPMPYPSPPSQPSLFERDARHGTRQPVQRPMPTMQGYHPPDRFPDPHLAPNAPWPWETGIPSPAPARYAYPGENTAFGNYAGPRMAQPSSYWPKFSDELTSRDARRMDGYLSPNSTPPRLSEYGSLYAASAPHESGCSETAPWRG
ncbi:hypothetical protein DFP72DRAFT_938070 [Ephemerocybe angulata]|uniref:Uncharacterized protein n=1 Tax=Ephemerocybe angulata TaxID=980116 RepID=A0A8H6LTV6_9AGAR|nr:hypothetical protein DFP72DRAFT_938070 [Tulosesus angulatus]